MRIHVGKFSPDYTGTPSNLFLRRRPVLEMSQNSFCVFPGNLKFVKKLFFRKEKKHTTLHVRLVLELPEESDQFRFFTLSEWLTLRSLLV
jgi:hypothetical protein